MRKFLMGLMTAVVLIAAPAPQAAGTKKAPAKTEAANPATKTEKKTETKSGPLIDVNAATTDELKALPGIGDAYSQKIIQNRPYTNKTQIVSKAGIPQSTYDKIKDQIVAHQAKSAAGKASAAKSKK
jgi:competence protein ComEA